MHDAAQVGGRGGAMKRKSLSFASWTCIQSGELRVQRLTEPFHGYVTQLRIHEVTEPQVWHWQGAPLTVCDRGMRWLSILPERGDLCITAQIGADDAVALWYIDMIAGQGVDELGVPWFDDLYLDLIVNPDGAVVVDDRDELDEALRLGDITAAQHQRALDVCAMLQKGLEGGVVPLQTLTDQCDQLVRNAPVIPRHCP